MAKILVVDDEPAIREIIILMIEMNGEFDIYQAASGNEAINFIKKEKSFDLVLCDYRMPDGDGGKVYSFLSDNAPGVPFVMVSSEVPEDHEEMSQLLIDNPKNGYVAKPIEATEIAKHLSVI